MTDIVERLRDPDADFNAVPLLKEAAGEIERLRVALHKSEAGLLLSAVRVASVNRPRCRPDMRARLKTEVCDVWQYMPRWVAAVTELRDDGLYLVRASGKQRIEAGDWLIRDLDGDPEWMADADFQREYEWP